MKCQILVANVCLGDNLHEMSNLVLRKNEKNISKCHLPNLPIKVVLGKSVINSYIYTILFLCDIFYAPPFSIGGGGGGGQHIVSPLSVRTAIQSLPSIPYVTQMVSVRYLLKKFVYWIEVLYTGI